MDTSMRTDEHWAEVDRLWSAFARNLSGAVLYAAGVTDDGKPMDRLQKTWTKICDLDLDAAGKISHGIDELHTALRDDRVTEHRQRQMNEILGMAKLARETNPDATFRTVGEAVEAGERAIQGELNPLDEETGR